MSLCLNETLVVPWATFNLRHWSNNSLEQRTRISNSAQSIDLVKVKGVFDIWTRTGKKVATNRKWFKWVTERMMGFLHHLIVMGFSTFEPKSVTHPVNKDLTNQIRGFGRIFTLGPPFLFFLSSSPSHSASSFKLSLSTLFVSKETPPIETLFVMLLSSVGVFILTALAGIVSGQQQTTTSSNGTSLNPVATQYGSTFKNAGGKVLTSFVNGKWSIVNNNKEEQGTLTSSFVSLCDILWRLVFGQLHCWSKHLPWVCRWDIFYQLVLYM